MKLPMTNEERFVRRAIYEHRKLRPYDKFVDYKLYWEHNKQRWSVVVTSDDGDDLWHSEYELYVDGK